MSTQTAADLEMLQALNRDYIDSVQAGDVSRFNQLLAEDYYCSNPDGSLVDRHGFLEQTAKPVTIANLRAENVLIRFFGDIAIIHGRTSYGLPDGREAHGRYTDVWARQGNTWKTISAHVTRG
ncbi:MAG TPA: nuclear transport factor 2 family protein [Steroidobacteraceae bacterium]|jgi:ketosteroid isomerase-like protein|nr:nuclear transport factor 2 family protein [Steroidobacteraceae bacterium]